LFDFYFVGRSFCLFDNAFYLLSTVGVNAMKRYTSSELTNKRAKVIKEAKAKGVIIECRNTNGKVVDELVLVTFISWRK
jgi:hypothetical protein